MATIDLKAWASKKGKKSPPPPAQVEEEEDEGGNEEDEDADEDDKGMPKPKKKIAGNVPVGIQAFVARKRKA
jgi:hypothetical protein